MSGQRGAESAGERDELPIGRHVLHHRVRYHEVDPQGFMFNSRYLELADVAMTEFFRALGIPYLELVSNGTDPSVVEARLRFSRPARFEDVLDIAVTCPRVGTSSFDLTTTVSRQDREIARTMVTYVNVDVETGTSRPLPAAVAAALRNEI